MKSLNDILWNNEDLIVDDQGDERGIIVTPDVMSQQCWGSYSSEHWNPCTGN